MKKFTIKVISAVLILLVISVPAAAKEVLAGGIPFGIKLYSDGLVVVKTDEVECDGTSRSPAADAGLMKGDLITEANGEKLSDTDSFIKLVSLGRPIELTYMRNGVADKTTVVPTYSKTDGRYRVGLWLRDSAAGIGTVTYVEPETLEFAGLGHGVCDTESGALVPMERGECEKVDITGVEKGVAGDPGELKGIFPDVDTGVIIKNTERGVFGKLDRIPSELTGETVETAKRSDVHTGAATLITTVDGGGRREYEIEITKTCKSPESHSFEVKVTDGELIEKTGGIVQGMSGSPILQDGRLVGALTHVMINDPTRGYGIYVECMMSAA